MYWQTTRQNHVKDLLDFADKAMHVPLIITQETGEEHLKNLNIGK